jgi:hypothetical protein
MRKNLDDILFCIGSLTICAGIAMWTIPGAILALGVFIMLASYSLHKVGK